MGNASRFSDLQALEQFRCCVADEQVRPNFKHGKKRYEFTKNGVSTDVKVEGVILESKAAEAHFWAVKFNVTSICKVLSKWTFQVLRELVGPEGSLP